MAIVFDKELGNTSANTSTGTIALTTTAAAASGTRIVVGVAWFGAVNASSASGGGLAWVVDKQQTNGSDRAAVISADAPAGLASSTTITVTLSGNATGRAIGATSWTGVATGSSGYVDVTGGSATTTTSWSTGNMIEAADGDLAYGVALGDGTGSSSTPISPSLEDFDINFNAASESITAAYRIDAAHATVTVAGTWLASMANGSVTAGMTFKAAAAAVAPVRVPVLMAPYIQS